ncbi:MAG: class I SAM-dependent methyltransferase [Maritimibacter sp.]|jgi:SAM-dependent methyltransferase
MREAFFVLHSDLPREGPGNRESLDWALSLAGTPENALILDAGCGPGADIDGLLENAPRGHVTAVDAHLPFVEQVRVVWHDDDRVTTHVGDMCEETGPYDLIWCAGSLYYTGIEDGLKHFRNVLAPGGAVAFSELVWLDTPSPALQAELEKEYPDIGDIAMLERRISAAGYNLQGVHVLSDDAWEDYYTPMEKRIEMLKPVVATRRDHELAQVLNDARREIALWRENSEVFGYAMAVVRPL